MSLDPIADSRPSPSRDGGAILLLVLGVSIVLSLVVLALANFVAADLRYAQVVDAQAKRLASAESGIDYALDRLRLNQTLCATDVAGSPVNLNGAASPGTPLPQPLNGTDTRITCERLDGTIADVAGWAVVIANYGESPPNDQIRVDKEDTGDPDHINRASINGPIFLRDARRTSANENENAYIGVVDGDLWSNCTTPDSNTYLEVNEHIEITPESARGAVCTTRTFGSMFSELPPPTPAELSTYLVDQLPDDTTYPGCRVFRPGRYTAAPGFTGATPDAGGTYHAYFMSGEYHFVLPVSPPPNAGEWLITDATIWAGGPGPSSPAPEVANGQCAAARAADTANGPGATFYFEGESRIALGARGALEIFPRQQDNYVVSIQALSATPTAQPVLSMRSLSGADMVIHGLVWAPHGEIDILEGDVSTQKLLGGVVVKRLLLVHTAPDLEIRPAKSIVKTQVMLTSTSTLNGATTKVEAIVDYRPDAVDLEDRVAVTSFRVVD